MVKRHVIKIIVLLVVLCSAQILKAQSATDRAKAYYFEAATAFEKSDYNKVINYCQQVEDILGNSNARVEALRIKSYYELGETAKAQQALKSFYTYPTDENLTQEVAGYIVKIEEKAEHERTYETCGRCYGVGSYDENVPCDYCYGGKITCDADCSWCKGRGRLYGRNASHGSVQCGMCNGSGKWGTKSCICNICNGSGYTGRTRTKTCPTCNGKGDVLRK